MEQALTVPSAIKPYHASHINVSPHGHLITHISSSNNSPPLRTARYTYTNGAQRHGWYEGAHYVEPQTMKEGQNRGFAHLQHSLSY